MSTLNTGFIAIFVLIVLFRGAGISRGTCWGIGVMAVPVWVGIHSSGMKSFSVFYEFAMWGTLFTPFAFVGAVVATWLGGLFLGSETPKEE